MSFVHNIIKIIICITIIVSLISCVYCKIINKKGTHTNIKDYRNKKSKNNTKNA